MKAHDSYLAVLLKLNDAVFNIPVYQRNYDWDVENCQQLFTDIENVAETQKEHFIGSIVYISIGTATEPYYNIIDGQQRITSVMLFLKALHDSSDDEKFRKQIWKGFLINDMDDDPKMKLKQIESDSAVYEKIIMQEDFDEDQYTDKEKTSNVFRNYRRFYTLIEQSDVPLEALYQAVFKLEIIDVMLTSEDPQEVFESMNSTGKSLTNTDLLRNYLLMDLSHEQQSSLYKKYWSKIEQNVGAKLMEQFMVHYLIVKRKSDSINLHRRSSKVNKTTLYECFKIYFPAEKKKDNGTEALLSEIYEYSTIYKKIVNNKDGKTELDRAIREVINELNSDSVAIFLMYLLHLQKTDPDTITEEEMLQAVKACISYVFRVRLFKGSVSNQFFALAIQYYEKTEDADGFVDRVWKALISGQGTYRFPKNAEFQEEFETKKMYLEFKPQMLRYILYKFERAKTKEVVEPENATIEHILPQEPKQWIPYLSEIKDTEYSEQMHKIGNLTLTKMNTEASNDVFEVKKEIYKKSGYAITREIASEQSWNSAVIKSRSRAMAKKALELWPLPEQYNDDTMANEQRYDVMDDKTEELFEALREQIREYYPFMRESMQKQYMNCLKNKTTILSIIPAQSYLFITLNAKPGSLSGDSQLEDVQTKGHWGVGNYRLKAETEEDLWKVLDYIQVILDQKK